VYAFIPGISLSGDSHSFIQVLNGKTGESRYLRYPLSSFSAVPGEFDIRVGESRFSEDGIELNIDKDNLSIRGSVSYRALTPFPGTVFRPGIMGPYSHVPFMECKHGVVSVNHTLAGQIDFNGRTLSFSNGKGYIEKDWGSSFPETWIWLQSNHFEKPGTSFMLSIAKIPWMGRWFMGFLGFFHDNGHTSVFAAYNRSRIQSLTRLENGKFSAVIESPDAVYDIEAEQLTGAELKAPVSGSMNRIIKESADSVMRLRVYSPRGTERFSGTGECAGLEIIDSIFGYFT
jgi:hypothetical protein